MIEWKALRLKWCGGKSMSEVNEPIMTWMTGQIKRSPSSRAMPFKATNVPRESFIASGLLCPQVDVEQESADRGQDDPERRRHRVVVVSFHFKLDLVHEPLVGGADEDQRHRVGADRRRDTEQEGTDDAAPRQRHGDA